MIRIVKKTNMFDFDSRAWVGFRCRNIVNASLSSLWHWSGCLPTLKRVVSGSRHEHLRRSRERHFATLLHATFMSRSERSTGRIVKPSHGSLALAMPFATVFAESVDLLPHRASGNIAVHSLPDLPAQVFRIKAIWMANLQPFWLPRIWGLSAHLRDSKSHAKRRWWTWGL